MGEEIGGALIQSINDFTTPGLSEATKKKKKFKYDKPLIDTGIMLNNVYYQVEEEEKVHVEPKAKR